MSCGTDDPRLPFQKNPLKESQNHKINVKFAAFPVGTDGSLHPALADSATERRFLTHRCKPSRKRVHMAILTRSSLVWNGQRFQKRCAWAARPRSDSLSQNPLDTERQSSVYIGVPLHTEMRAGEK